MQEYYTYIRTRKSQGKLSEKHEKMCNEIHEMYIKKNSDYGDSVGELYRRLGDISFLTRISDKYNRLMNLMTKDKPEQHFESIQDTIQDMANYCIIWLMEMEVMQEDIEEALSQSPEDENVNAPYIQDDYDNVEYVIGNSKDMVKDIAERITKNLNK